MIKNSLSKLGLTAVVVGAALVAVAGCSSSSAPAPTASSVMPGPSTSGGAGIPGSYTTCAQLYATLATKVLSSQTIDPATIDKWAKQAKAAALAARNGNLAEAQSLCEQSVKEMEAVVPAN